MRQSNIMFENLRAEMARSGVGITDVSKAIGMNRDTLARKLSGKSPIHLNDAFVIQRTLFPNSDIQYLFAEADEKQ